MKYTLITAAALGAATLGLAACGGNTTAPPRNLGTPTGGLATPFPTNPPAITAAYTQIELWGRPAVKEAFENFNDHKTTNAVEPYVGSPADPLQGEIKSFEDTVRPPSTSANTDYGTTLQAILYPDEMQVNLADTTDKASYLGIETKGATGGLFGGRDLSDDVVDISLGAAFGNTLSKIGVLADDGEENTCISSDNLPSPRASQTKTSTFPYLAGPH
jgi:hypothetical protein